MKLISEGKVSLEIDEAAVAQAASDDGTWKLHMLQNSTEQVVLLRESRLDHREFRKILYRALVLLTAVAVAVGVPVGVMY